MTPFVSAFLEAVALRVALADPDRIRTLTLVDSAGLGQAVHRDRHPAEAAGPITTMSERHTS